MMDDLDTMRAMELLQKAEPGWKTTQAPGSRENIYTKPAEPRVSRFSMDDGLGYSGADSLLGSNGSGGGGGGGKPPGFPIQILAGVFPGPSTKILTVWATSVDDA